MSGVTLIGMDLLATAPELWRGIAIDKPACRLIHALSSQGKCFLKKDLKSGIKSAVIGVCESHL